jgi:hypothetical protein
MLYFINSEHILVQIEDENQAGEEKPRFIGGEERLDVFSNVR